MITQLNHPAIKASLLTHSDNSHTVTIEPLLPGFGHTLGNALRRFMLSYIPGYSVTKIRINDLTHEYQPIEGVVEDGIDVILNLKRLRARILTDDESVTLKIHKTNGGEVYAKDFEKNANVRIINEDLYICTLDKNADVSIEVEIARGIGFKPVEDRNASSTNPQDIFVDALYSPITNLSFDVAQVRVGDKTNFDKVEITFDTDKTVDPTEVVTFALSEIAEQYKKIQSAFETSADMVSISAIKSTSASDNNVADAEVTSVDENETINLPARIRNILEKNGVTTNTQLKAAINDVEEYAGIGESALETIKSYVESL